MNNEVPGASVPPEILERMKRAATKDAAFNEGIAIARDTCQRIRNDVAGIQLAAPLGRIEGIFMMLAE